MDKKKMGKVERKTDTFSKIAFGLDYTNILKRFLSQATMVSCAEPPSASAQGFTVSSTRSIQQPVLRFLYDLLLCKWWMRSAL